MKKKVESPTASFHVSSSSSDVSPADAPVKSVAAVESGRDKKAPATFLWICRGEEKKKKQQLV